MLFVLCFRLVRLSLLLVSLCLTHTALPPSLSVSTSPDIPGRMRASRCLGVVVVAVLLLLLLGPGPVDAGGCSSYNNIQLIQKCGPKYFDLRNILGQDGSNLLKAMDVQRGSEYFVQFDGTGVPKKLPNCTVDSDTNNLGVQMRLDGGGCYTLGSVDHMTFDFDNATKQFSVKATDGDKGRSMMVNTQCTFGADYASLTETGWTGNRYNFNLNLPSKRCTTSPPSMGGDGDGASLSLGVILGIGLGSAAVGALGIGAVIANKRR